LQRRWLPYLVALAAVCAALALRAALDPWLGPRVPYITMFGAIIVAAWYGGAGPALLAAAAAWIAAQLRFVEPRGQLNLRGVQDAIEIVAYAVSSLLIAGLGGAMQSARQRSTETEQRFRAFMQNSPSGVFLKDEEGRYVFMNRAGERLVGRTDWLGKTDDELIPGRAARDIRGHDRAVLEESSPRLYDLRLPTPKGARRRGARYRHAGAQRLRRGARAARAARCRPASDRAHRLGSRRRRAARPRCRLRPSPHQAGGSRRAE
jgi:PAS domain S-box-containing protein